MNKDNKIDLERKDEELEDVSGGFIGKDWSDDYKELYERLGIKHTRNFFRRDKYEYNGEKISRAKAKEMAEAWIRENVPGYFK